jgi:hypothetical protein
MIKELRYENDSTSGSRRGSLTPSGKVLYEIEVTILNKTNAGMTQNGWIIINENVKFSSGQTNTFAFQSRTLGELCQIILGHEERRDYPLESHLDREAQWNVILIPITDSSTGTIYDFLIGQWIDIN